MTDLNQLIIKFDYEKNFKDEKEIKVLSKIDIKNNKVIKSNSFNNINLQDEGKLKKIIFDLKIIYEDFWKEKILSIHLLSYQF